MSKILWKAKKSRKKLMVLAILIVMLSGYLIDPIRIFATEDKNSTEIINVATDNNYKEDVNFEQNENGDIAEENKDNEENKEYNNISNTENEVVEKDSVLKEEDKKEENNSTSSEKIEENETAEKDETVEPTNVSKTENEESSNVNTEKNGNEIKENSNNSTKQKKETQKSVQKDSRTTSIEELLKRIKPTTKENLKTTKENDNYEINEFKTQFVSGATKDKNENLVWTPSNEAKEHEFSFRVNYAISGLKELPAESIQITIPKSILRNREGKLDDKYIMSLPKSEEYNGKTEFAYIENEDYIVVYNPEEVKAGINGYFEIAYATKLETFNYKDYDTKNTETVANGGTASDPFYAIIKVETGETGKDTLIDLSDDTNVYIDTTAKITSTQKRYPTLYRTWNSSWMEQAPENSDEYYYLVWELCTKVSSPTQPYNFTIKDFVTDLTKGTNGQDYELVGYKLSGEKYFSDKNTQENITRSGTRYDYVLTRHKISTYKGIEYTLKNTETATVDPIDQVDSDTKATSSNTFNWNPVFVPPTGHFNLFKYGNNNWHNRFGYHWDYANYDLDKLQKNEVNELKGFKYFTETIGYAYLWTLKEGGSSDKPEDYGKNLVTYDTWDDTLYLEGDTNPMNYEDYYLENLTYSVTNNDAEYDEFYNRFEATTPTYKNNETIIFYGKFNGEKEWTQIGTYNLETKEITPNDKYVDSITENKITFKEGVHCTGWRFTTANTHYYTYITVTPNFVLTNSKYVSEKIKNKDSIKIKNNVSTNITDYKGKTIFKKETSGVDYARVTYYDSEITKKVSSVSNNPVEKKHTITWKVNAWEKATSGSGIAEYIRQNSGTFYDLIPLGGEIDLKSIQVQTEKGFLAENEYTCEAITNYNNSGRTMLIVKIKEQAQYYTVFYNTVHTWENMKDYGKNVLNPVAYETGNEKITKGYADNGGNLSSENKKLFTNLDNTTDAKKFIYTEQTHNINAVTAAISGLYKKVKTSKDTEYSYGTEVEPNGNYSYQLRYQNTYINKAKKLILFDSLENFKVIDNKEVKTSGWKGTLKFVDLTQLKGKGIDAVVYVSTVENLNLDAHNDINDTSIWRKVVEGEDLSNVTAIAIDMTKGTDGSEYILDAGESVTAVLHMQAPEDVTEKIEENPYTYNNVYIKNTLIDELEGTMEYFIHQDYTTVKYHIITDVPFYKVNAKNESETIKGITFRLYGTSNYGTKVDEYVTSDNNGYVNFKDIEAGEYILQEYEGTPDWLEDHTEHTVKVVNKNEVYIDEKLVTEEEPIKITNAPRIHTDVTFTKRNLVNNFTIEGAKFKLEGTSNYGNEILMYATSGEDGTVKFEDLEYGTYELTEIEVPEGYVLNKDLYRVIVDENGNYDIQKNVPKIELEPKTITRYSHTSNINDTGRASSDYSNNLATTDIVTIEGAESLQVTVYYSTESTSYDWVSVYDASVTPSASNYSSSKSGKLGGNAKTFSEVNGSGYQTACSKWTGTITGDTAKLFFRSDGSVCKYGYYAIITATIQEEVTVQDYESIYDNGKYNIYNEPLHSFRLIKRDSYNDKAIGGAKFKIYGTSDNGNTYNKEITSTPIGFVDFTGIESGMYVLQETYVPEVTDENGNKISYILDENKYIVNIEKNGNVTIDGIEKNENGNFVFYNKRNKGQITITKKWIDDSNNEERPEPTIIISTQKTLEGRSAFFRNNYSSDYGPLYYITNDTSYRTKITGSFARNTSLSENEVKKLGATRLDREYNNPNAEYKIYGWIDSNGNCWWWSNAEVALLTDSSNKMFYNLSYAKSIDTTGINTSKVTNMSEMFWLCDDLTELNVSNFDTSKVTNMSEMFGLCFGLTELNVSNFDTSNVTDMSRMFYRCIYLAELDLSGFDTSNVTTMSSMFYDCYKLTELDVSNFDTSNVTTMGHMFKACKNLTELDVSNFDTSKVTNMNNMFDDCYDLTKLDVSNFDTSDVTTMRYMFSLCNNLTELDVSNFDTSNVTTMEFMFEECNNLTELDVSNFDTSKVTSMYEMFAKCEKLTELDLSGFDTSKVTSMYLMFYHCYNLTTIYASEKFVTRQVTNSGTGPQVFDDCNALVGGNGTKYNSSYEDKTYARIDKAGQPGYFTYKAPKTATINTNNKNIISTSKLFNEIKDIIETNNDEPITISETTVKEIMPIFSSKTVYNAENENTNSDNNVLTYSTANTNYDDQGNEINWVKNGDTWTYTFYVDDPNATWYVWEEPLEGYSSNYTTYYPGVVEEQKATIINQKGSTPEDTKPTVGFGSLAISKTLLGVYDDGVRPITDDDTEFTFKVKLTAKPGYESFISGTKVFGDYIFKDGVGTVKVRAGETVTISGLPLGTTYKVTEEAMPEYQVTGYYGFSEIGGSSGTISNKTTTISATNYKDERTSSTTPVEKEKTTSFTVAKKVTGNYEIEDNYNFEIVLNNLKENTTYKLSNGKTFTSDSNGLANVSVCLKNDESITVQNIPVGSKYKVYEHAGNYVSSYVITDANNAGLINNSSNNNTKENIAISTATETADEGEDIIITFTNKKTVTQNLKLVKKVTDEKDKNSYIFDIEFANMEPGTSFNSSVGKVTADSKGKAKLTIYLAGGEEAEIYHIPVGTTYKITELASSSIASYTIKDVNGTNKIVKESGANTNNKTALSTEVETINEGEEVTVTFINDTVNQEPDSVSASLGVTKNVLNIKGETLENCQDTFTFEIAPDNENNPMPEKNNIEITGNGTESFGTIIFTKTGTYTYKITEKAGELHYYNYDDTVYTIIYEVINVDGLLEVTKTVKRNGFIGDSITFTNRISKVDVKILKTDEEGNPLNGATLQILDSKGNIVKEWTTGENTKEKIKIHQSKGTYTTKLPIGTYTLREAKTPEGYETAKDIKFTVNEDGKVEINGEVVEEVIMVDLKVKEEPKNPENNKEETNKIIETIKTVTTGDAMIYAITTLAVASIALIMVLVIIKKTSKKDEKK